MNKYNYQILNTPFEISLRLLIILTENSNYKFDIERLSYYDYISVNLGDYTDDYKSLHPKSPYRKGELAVKRPLVKAGLLLLIKKDLVKVHYTAEGFSFYANEYNTIFVEQLKCQYAAELKENIKITSKLLKYKTNEEIREFFEVFTKIYDAEFNNEVVLRGVQNEE